MAEQTSPGDGTTLPDDTAVDFETLLKEELKSIKNRRTAVFGAGSIAHLDLTPGDPSGGSEADVFEDAQRFSTLGLSFSGGGIRSATFNLGVLQGLAEIGLLRHIDYLSTVSGGGYIGSWLHGVMRRRMQVKDGEQKQAENAEADEQLKHVRRTLRRGIKQEPGAPDDDPITFLRKYSNYLAPRPGLFSADTWTIGFIWLRNVLLNQLILVPAIAAAVSVVLLATFLLQLQAQFFSSGIGADVGAAAIALLCLGLAWRVMGKHLAPIANRSLSHGQNTPMPKDSGTATVIFAFLAALALGVARFDASWRMGLGTALVLGLVLGIIQVTGGFIDCYVARHGEGRRWMARLHVVLMSLASGAVAAALLVGVWSIAAYWEPWARLTLGPPLVGLCFVLSVMLLVGLMGADYPDAAREWTAKVGSLLGILIAAWLGLFGLMLYGPWAVSYALGNFQKSGALGVAVWIATTLGGVLAGRSSGTAAETGSPSRGRLVGILIAAAPTVFLVGYIVAIATGVHMALRVGDERPAPVLRAASAPQPVTVNVSAPGDSAFDVSVTPADQSTLQNWLQPAADFAARYPEALSLSAPQVRPASAENRPERRRPVAWATLLASGPAQKRFVTMWLVLFGALLVAAVASVRININEFSLHHFYKNRLVRCYLGASNTRTRKPHPLTGFDPLDDMPIARLDALDKERPYFGPYPIINAALNLNAGSELATQERKAASFVFTPHYCGFSTKRYGDDAGKTASPKTNTARQPVRNDSEVETFERDGYRPTSKYAYEGGPNIGTAVAISGAAANPNWGYHTSGPMAFLLTVFNARLGWWLGNPRFKLASREPGPKFALRYLFAELLGQTTGRSKFVNLSDGGHFDNLGLYELVQRRCRFIIVCDAEEDQKMTFGSLGAAIRKCRADFGVEIDIDPYPIVQKEPRSFSTAHCVVGTIFYPDDEKVFSAGITRGFADKDNTNQQNKTSEKSRGWLLYLKSSLTGDEPADVLEYRSQFPEFPHQSTADQFFGESQFESYRRLGYHVCRSAFGTALEDTRVSAPATASKYPLVALFQQLTRQWYAPIPVSNEAATRLADAYVELLGDFAKDPKLKDLFAELSGQTSPAPQPATTTTPTTASTAEISAAIALMQLVQNVYTEFGFESALNRANPRNSGWMSVFRKWHKSPILMMRIWPTIRGDYHDLFVTFVEDHLLEESKVAERP